MDLPNCDWEAWGAGAFDDDELKSTWTSKDGQVYEICDMDTQHIRCCIAMLEREDKVGDFYGTYTALKAELRTRPDKVKEVPMGDMADFALDNAMDDIDCFDRWERDGSCPQEGYELGILNERGGLEELPHPPYFSARYRDNYDCLVTCKNCGTEGLHWTGYKGKWYLFNEKSQQHVCERRKQDAAEAFRHLF